MMMTKKKRKENTGKGPNHMMLLSRIKTTDSRVEVEVLPGFEPGFREIKQGQNPE